MDGLAVAISSNGDHKTHVTRDLAQYGSDFPGPVRALCGRRLRPGAAWSLADFDRMHESYTCAYCRAQLAKADAAQEIHPLPPWRVRLAARG